MRTTITIIGLHVILLALVAPCSSIGPQPRDDGLAGEGTRYFRLKPGMIDVPQVPSPIGATDKCRALVLLIDFEDKVAQRDTSYFRDMLFGGAPASMKAYFDENSYGTFSITGRISDWLRSSCRHGDIVNRDREEGTADDYGLDTSPGAIDEATCDFPLNIWGLVAHAATLAGDRLNFAMYDNDGPDGIPSSGDDDGFVDALFVVHSGQGAEDFGGLGIGVDYIWSLQSNLDYYEPTSGTTVQGVRVGAFVLVPEMGEIGVFAHEFCHLLGLPDLYDPDTGLPVVGPLCLMDEGAWNGPQHSRGSVPSHLCAPMKYILGWIEPNKVCFDCDGSPIVEGASISPHGTTPYPYQVLSNPGGPDWTPGGTGRGEYFMLENRQTTHGYFESYLPASGLIIWRVDESQTDNSDPEARLAEVIQADGEVVDYSQPGMNVPGEASDFWPGSLGKRDFTPQTDPSSELRGGRFSGASVRDITQLSGGVIEADIMVGAPRKGTTYAYPNPYRLSEASAMRIVFVPDPGPDVPHTGSFEVTIFDLEGNFVRRLDAAGEIRQEGFAEWDGKDESGNWVDTGLYFYYVTSSGQQATGVLGIRK